MLSNRNIGGVPTTRHFSGSIEMTVAIVPTMTSFLWIDLCQSCQDVVHDMPVDISETELPTRVKIGQAFVIEAQQM